MRFGFVTLGAKVPSTRFRFFDYRKPLEQAGHDCRYWTSRPSVYDYDPRIGWRLSHAFKRSVRHLQLLDASWFRPDCIYLERGCMHDKSTDLDQKFRKRTGRLVLDVDDGIFLQFPQKIPALIRMSDHVVVSNQTIFEYVRQFHDRITLIPTSVLMERYQAKPAATTDRLTIGWIGTGPNAAFLQVCARALRRLAKERSFSLLVVASSDQQLRQVDLSGVDYRFEIWHPDLEIAHLHQMDIGIMPLPSDQDWMQYKAATKLVQYMAVGIPAVASPIGVNRSILQGNRVGYAASNDDQWFDSLRSLLDDAELRQRMGGQGRALASESFSIESNAPRLIEVLSPTGRESRSA